MADISIHHDEPTMARSEKRSLLEVVTALIAVLDESKSDLSAKIAQSNEDDTTLRLQISSVQHKIKRIDDEAEKSILRWTFLDTSDFEELSSEYVSGERVVEHKAKRMSITPNLQILLTTRFPIRKVEEMLSDGLRFKSHTEVLGSMRYAAEIKTKSFKSAKAEIKLFGWRKEIHAAEIGILTEKIARLEKDRTEAEPTICRIQGQREVFQRDRKGWQDALDLGEQDRAALIASHLNTARSSGKLDKYLEVGSIAGVAQHLGLKTKFPMAKLDISKAMFADLRALMYRCTDHSRRTTYELEKHLEDVNRASKETARVVEASDECLNSASTITSHLSANLHISRTSWKLQVAPAHGADELLALAERDLKELYLLSGTLTADIERGQHAVRQNRNDNSDEDESKKQRQLVNAALESTRKELAAMETATAMLSETPKPLGFVAEMQHKSTFGQVWHSLYAGEMIRGAGS
ncbi:hypothetical protein BDV96DRAFT_562858 [Lophiotrema nucula]|uniref:Uncharacterized protein n=1 Tax=Lophiotrema nucula TaxID=690887 RepID=A0A6A5ZQV4_9PLEO|nr:hypothetical protein BDV96DRAFT_562858 [Lophiotrema nucula]